jgi:hypothetical protein
MAKVIVRSVFAAWWAALVLVSCAFAQEAPTPEEAQRRAAAYRAAIEDIDVNFGRFGEVTAADRAQVHELYTAAAAQWEAVAKGLVLADAEAKANFNKLAETGPSIARWRGRFEARARQAELVLPEEQVNGRWFPPGLYAPRDEWIEARRLASEAWADVAEAIAPDVPAEKLAALRTRAVVAEFEMEMADLKYSWMRDFFTAIRSGTLDVASPEFKEAMDELLAAREAVLRQKRIMFEQQLKLRELDLLRRDAEKRAADAFEVARRQPQKK